MPISVERLRRVYGSVTAVEDLSFSVQSGEIVGLLGPNGAGKTTTLRSLAGILRPTSGRIVVGGHDLQASPLEAKRQLAFMPDEPQLFEYMTVDDHLRFVARLYGVADAGTRIEPLLHELELADKRTALPAELSRGMRQKLAIACAFLHQPKALLLDEPLTGLDPLGIRRMKAAILRRAQAGAAVILSSHLLHLVEELCTRILIIQNGQAMVIGTIAEIAASRPQLAGRGLEELFLAITGQDTPDASGAGIAGQ
jgi:ABC-2 type transport system ATP-binding protein